MRMLWAFARPHTIIGTVLAVIVLYLLAAAAAGRHDVGGLATVLVASVAINVYIVGLNQLTDIAIDRINKPWLPLAAGEMGVATGRQIVVLAGLLALGLAAWQGPYLLATIVAVGAIGTAYSLPPLRLKRFPFWATAAITLARGVISNVGVYLAYAVALGAPAGLPINLLAFVGFLVVFVSVIGLMKDVPDVAGDQANGIRTLAARHGAAATMRLCLGLLSLAYLGMIAVAMAGRSGMHPLVVVAGHGFGLVVILGLWQRYDLGCRVSSQVCYRRVWQLFYVEFLLFGLGSLLA